MEDKHLDEEDEMAADRTVSIAGLDKAQVLEALWKGASVSSHPILAVLAADNPRPSKQELVQALSGRGAYVDYLRGRSIKCAFNEDQVNVSLYDRDNGQGRFAEIVGQLRIENRGKNAQLRKE